MATALDVINRALRNVGALASGETADANDALESLEILNDIIDQWSLEDLMITNSVLVSSALTNGVGTYTIGPTGTIALADAPIEVLNAYIRNSSNVDSFVEVVSFEQYQEIILKSTTGSYPTVMGVQYSSPDVSLYLWPTPTSGLTLRIVYTAALTNFASLATVVTFPSGYQKALVDALSQELCVKYGRTEMLSQISQTATMSKMVIKRKNSKTTQMSIDPAFLTGRQRAYNPYSDT